ncbi:hypothetical protein KC866_02440 [Patescibacteria group bacterium]|nr:hypothetical protein [Patescibacteria group bacterium]
MNLIIFTPLNFNPEDKFTIIVADSSNEKVKLKKNELFPNGSQIYHLKNCSRLTAESRLNMYSNTPRMRKNEFDLYGDVTFDKLGDLLYYEDEGRLILSNYYLNTKFMNQLPKPRRERIRVIPLFSKNWWKNIAL